MRTTSMTVLVVLALSVACWSQTFDAKKQFQTKCAMCHGADGKTPTMIGKNLGAADLTSDKVQKMIDKQLHETIEHGKGKMPDYGTSLSNKDIDLMVKYVRSLKK